MEHASPEIRRLYYYLEVEFDPLLLSERVMPLLDTLRDDSELGQYVDSLQEITLVRLIKQVGGRSTLRIYKQILNLAGTTQSAKINNHKNILTKN